MTFSEQLIYLRKQKGLSQEQLGEVIGVTRQTVSKWELGDTTPEMDKLVHLGDFFSISIDALVGREEVNSTDTNSKAAELYRWHYEYKSKRTFRGMPLVHINIGHGLYKAKGIVAIGNVAKGLLSIGILSTGIISLGTICLGMLSLGAFSAGILAAVGGISIGTIAVGGLAVGVLAIGGCAVGIYSIGGCAIALKVAAGGYAHAPIAIGDKTTGETVFHIRDQISSDAIKNAILQKYPNTWKSLVELFSLIN